MASLEAVFYRHWAYISREKIAPVWLGEFGTSNRTEDVTGTASGSEGQWFLALTGMLEHDRAIHWASWALNGEDADGLLATNYMAAANPMKLAALNRIMTGGVGVEMPRQEVAGHQRNNRGEVSRPVSMRTDTAMEYIPHLPESVLHPGAGSAYDSQTLRQTAQPQTGDGRDF